MRRVMLLCPLLFLALGIACSNEGSREGTVMARQLRLEDVTFSPGHSDAVGELANALLASGDADRLPFPEHRLSITIGDAVLSIVVDESCFNAIRAGDEWPSSLPECVES